MYRSRSDSTPLRGRAATAQNGETDELAQGNINLSKRWRSWSFPQSQYGIPLGTLTAREASKSFWNTDMLKHRLEIIAECAAMETSSVHDDDEEEDSMENFTKREGHSASVNDDDLPAVGSTPVLIPSSEHATDLEDDWEELEQSAIRLTIDDTSCNGGTQDELLAIRSAPTLTQRQTEQCPSAIMSHSSHLL